MDQSFHLTNLGLGLFFIPLIFLEKTVIDWSQWAKPVLIGAAFFFGH